MYDEKAMEFAIRRIRRYRNEGIRKEDAVDRVYADLREIGSHRDALPLKFYAAEVFAEPVGSGEAEVLPPLEAEVLKYTLLLGISEISCSPEHEISFRIGGKNGALVKVYPRGVYVDVDYDTDDPRWMYAEDPSWREYAPEACEIPGYTDGTPGCYRLVEEARCAFGREIITPDGTVYLAGPSAGDETGGGDYYTSNIFLWRIYQRKRRISGILGRTEESLWREDKDVLFALEEYRRANTAQYALWHDPGRDITSQGYKQKDLELRRICAAKFLSFGLALCRWRARADANFLS
jgi:hypothetical protein